MKKFLITLFCLTLAFTTTACNKNADETEGPNEIPPVIDEKAPETNEYVVQNGNSDYKIVIDDEASSTIAFAATELQYFFQEATGIKLSIVNDEQVAYTETAKFFSIGENDLLFDANVTLDRLALGSSGLRVITEGNTLFLCGGGDDGALYAVYEWLSQEFDYEFYYENIWHIETGVKNLKLRDYDLTDIPDFAYRTLTQSKVMGSLSMRNRYRLQDSNMGNLRILEKSQASDGMLSKIYVPESVYGDAKQPENYHPDWYSADGFICLTGSAKSPSFNETEYQALVDTVSENICISFTQDLTGNRIVFGDIDSDGYCTCAACSAERVLYGNASGSMIKFANAVRAKVDEWMASEDGARYARDWKLDILVYAGYFEAPVKDGECTIICNEGVSAFIAPLNTEFLVPMAHEDNADILQNWYDWKKCSPYDMSAWLYGPNFKHFLLPLDSQDNVIEQLKILKECGGTMVFMQAQDPQRGLTTGWDMLKNYLFVKAMWDLDVDVNALIDNWFTVVYGSAADVMRDVYEEVRINQHAMVDAGLKRANNAYRDMLTAAYWNQSLLLRWMDKYDEALDLVARKGDGATVEKMIRAERVSTVYMLLEFNYQKMTKQDLYKYVETFADDCALIELNSIREAANESVDSLKKKYGYEG